MKARRDDMTPYFASVTGHSIGSSVGVSIRSHKKLQRAIEKMEKLDHYDEEEFTELGKTTFNALRAVAHARARNAKEAMERAIYLEAEWRRLGDPDMGGYDALLSIAVRRLDRFVEGGG